MGFIHLDNDGILSSDYTLKKGYPYILKNVAKNAKEENIYTGC